MSNLCTRLVFREQVKLTLGIGDIQMIADRDTAKQILDELFDLSGRLDWSVATVRDRCPESELIAYRRAIGQVMGEMWVAVLRPILAAHPDLTPPESAKGDA